jgi:hypothetical protein
MEHYVFFDGTSAFVGSRDDCTEETEMKIINFFY